MRTNRSKDGYGKGLVIGCLIAAGCLALIGARKAANEVRVSTQRFLVLESKVIDATANDRSEVLLKLCPHYGKITSDALKLRMDRETQELTILVRLRDGTRLRRGDIIGFETMDLLRLTEGSRVTRHLQSGGHELVP